MEDVPESSAGYEDRIDDFLKVRGITIGPITVKLFYLDPYGIGIHDLPMPWENFLANRDSVPPEKQAEYESYIANWRAEQGFVLLWGSRDFWLDGSGEITAS